MYSVLYVELYYYEYQRRQPEVFKTSEKVFKVAKQFYICEFIPDSEDIANMPEEWQDLEKEKWFLSFLWK